MLSRLWFTRSAPVAARTMASAASSSHLSAFEQSVGNTRLLRLRGPSEATGCEIYGKAEYENPGGSVKDRPALAMIREAEATGVLVRGEPGIVVEGTAGNTGIGLALAAKTCGYETVICLADTQSAEKKNTLRWAGARLVEVPAVPYRDANNYVHVAARLAEKLAAAAPGGARVFYANQWDNLANRRAHCDTTGAEIWRQTEGKVDAFSCAMGTGGTLTGVAQALRELSGGRVRIGLTDPEGAAIVSYLRTGELASHGSSISEGIGQGRVTGNMVGFRPDDDLIFEVSDEEMLPVLQDMQQNEGVCLGGSAGINVAGAMKVARTLGPGHTVVTVLCDQAGRYAGKLYNTQFLATRGLPQPSWLQHPMQLPEGLLEECMIPSAD